MKKRIKDRVTLCVDSLLKLRLLPRTVLDERLLPRGPHGPSPCIVPRCSARAVVSRGPRLDYRRSHESLSIQCTGLTLIGESGVMRPSAGVKFGHQASYRCCSTRVSPLAQYSEIFSSTPYMSGPTSCQTLRTAAAA